MDILRQSSPTRENLSLLIDLQHNPRLDRLPALEDGLAEAGYLLREAAPTDAPALETWITEIASDWIS